MTRQVPQAAFDLVRQVEDLRLTAYQDVAGEEEWRAVVGWEGFYEVSNRGRVRSLSRYVQGSKRNMRGRVLRQSVCFQTRNKSRVRCYVVRLSGPERLTRQVHRLVLRAFIGRCPPGMEGCHWDGSPANNHLSNLRWDTRKGNVADAIRHGTLPTPAPQPGEKNVNAKLTADDVRCIRAEPHYRGVSVMLGRAFGLNSSSIRELRNGKGWAHVQ